MLGEFRQGSLAQQSWGPMAEDITEEDMSHAFEDNHTQQQPHMLEAVVSPAEAEANDVFPDTTDRGALFEDMTKEEWLKALHPAEPVRLKAIPKPPPSNMPTATILHSPPQRKAPPPRQPRQQ